MNTYDFDQTIFNPDSSYAFVMYCLRHYPTAVLRAFPGMCASGLKHIMKKADTKELKEQVFSFLKYIKDIDSVVAQFWRTNCSGIGEWYLKQRKADDIIISASPEFLLEPIAAELGVRLIATPMDKNSGKINGFNCHDTEKVRRFQELYPGAHTENLYSDSLSDTPMAMLADRAYLVKKGVLSPWPKP